MSNYQITSTQYNSILKKHGRITEDLILKETGVKIPKKKRAKINQRTKQLSNVKFFLKNLGIEYKEEFYFAKPRLFRFDLAIPSQKISIEYEGMVSEFNKKNSTGKSGHTTVSGYTSNTEKYNLAASLGWVVLRYTFANVKNAVSDLEKLIKK